MLRLLVLWILCHTFYGTSSGVHFLPFGINEGDESVSIYDESSSQEVKLSVPVTFYGQKYDSAFVNGNGLISFGTEIPYYRNVFLKDLGYAVVGIFYADIDTQVYDDPNSSVGLVSYREEVNNLVLRSKVSKFIGIEYVDAKGFEAESLFISTWSNVGYYKGKDDKILSCQLVLASNRTSTYAMLQYEKVEWVRSEGKQAPEQDIPAQAGFVAQDQRFQMLTGSGSIEMNKMTQLSNVNKPGLFTFRISGEMPVDPRSLRLKDFDEDGDLMIHPDLENDDNYEFEDDDYDNYFDNYAKEGGSIYDEYYEPGQYEDTDDICPPLPEDDACPPSSCHFQRDTNHCLICVCNTVPSRSPPSVVHSTSGVLNSSIDSESEYAFAPVDCRSPKELGYVCDESMASIRWAYSEQRDRCLAFSFKGCGGNGNTFRSKDECETRCRPADGSICSGQLFESVSDVADSCMSLTCARGKVCRMGAFNAACCDETRERYYSQLVSPICPNGQDADISVQAESCADEPCAASIGFECIQINPFFAKCCAKGAADFKAASPESVAAQEAPQQTQMPTWEDSAPAPAPPLLRPPVEQSMAVNSASCDSAGGPQCDANAICVSGNGGSCCECNQGYYGNGQLCLKSDDPQRINGQFSGVINGERLNSIDLHTYVVTSDGRTYTALSQIPDSLGNTLQFLYTIGGVMGWLFATAESPYANGFQMTGGIFNRTATLHIGSSHSVTINQQFSGRHIQDYLKATVFVSGNLPIIPAQTQMQFTSSDYTQEYRTVQPGVIKSYSTQNVRIGSEEYDITIDQTIKFNICAFSNRMEDSQKLRVSQAYTQWAPEERILRYASKNSIVSPNSPDASCSGRVCDVNADCYPVSQGASDQFECVCKPGFEGNGAQCRPDPRYGRTQAPQPEPTPAIESSGIAAVCRAHEECHANGECKFNQALRQYQCVCRPPYSGDGYRCFLEAETCDVARNCDPYADCLVVRTEIGEGYKCVCKVGFSGDGLRCVPTTQSCAVAHNCDINADCIFERTDIGDEYRCRCKSGFTGDGITCQPLSLTPTVDCSTMNNCHPHAQCLYQNEGNSHKCVCIAGYSGDGYVCMDTRPSEEKRSCNDNSQCHPSGQCIQLEESDEFFCHCQYGFTGDGFNRCDPIDECAVGSNDCPREAECLFNESAMAYLCVCRPGYSGDGKTCFTNTPSVASPSVQPTTSGRAYVDCRSDPDECVLHSTCAPDYTLGGYVCQCEAGFTGDAYSKCDIMHKEEGCVNEDECDANADCVYNANLDKHECVCRSGHRGDGKFCTLASVNCYDDRTVCDENADCVPDSNSGYACVCRRGFHGSGRQCSPDSELRGQALVYAQGMALIQRGLSPDQRGKQLVVVSHQTAVGVGYDCQQDTIFWTDIAGHSLRSSNLEGGNMSVIIEDELESPEGIAVDWASRNIYYADSIKDIIGVVSMDGMYNKVLLDGLKDPRALEIDLQNKKLYYSDWYRDAPVIGRMSLDGSQREDFVTTDIGIPNDLTILHARKELCWADAGAQQQRLECISLDGRNRRTVYAPLVYPFGLTNHQENTFYWTDWNDNLVHSVAVNGQNYRKFTPDIPANAKPYGIVAIPRSCPPGDSPCSEESGGCPFMCLPNNRGSVSCVCPDNIEEEQCNRVDQLLVR